MQKAKAIIIIKKLLTTVTETTKMSQYNVQVKININ